MRSSCADVNSHNKIVVCYVGGLSWYNEFRVDHIDPVLCTHIIYAFSVLDNVTHSIQSLDPFLDTEEDGGKGIILKIKNILNMHNFHF